MNSSLPEYVYRQSYRAGKQSSYDHTGANHDFSELNPGQTLQIFSHNGPGAITHIWLTFGSGDPNALKDLVLRAYWDGNSKPSVEAPLGDFFGLNLNRAVVYESAFLNCSPSNALNCYFVMPFRTGASITIEHQGPKFGVSPTEKQRQAEPAIWFYWNIDYRSLDSFPPDCLYFHAQYRQKTPNIAVAAAPPNLNGANNYIFAETRGAGHLLGVTWGVQQIGLDWFGEGDDMTFIDNEQTPAIYGTGAEDYINGAWDFGGTFAHRLHGATILQSAGMPGGICQMYRWHADNPITFTTYMKHTIEHGNQNTRSDNYYSVCYWYQTVPYVDFPVLPGAEERIPPVIDALRLKDTIVRPPV